MATEAINGNYAPHQGYGSLEHQNGYNYNSTPSVSSQSTATQPPPTSSTPATTTTSVSAPAQQEEVPKEQVGWYFVESYYTQLSRQPEKLFLFYNKRSQFVSGLETEKVPVAVGQRAINDRITALDFHDCKVRVTNVDSQASDANIIIQVIGEISNKSQPHKRFTQTFLLAPQEKGYFVLNDIFRYLIDEEEEEPEAPVEAGGEQIQQHPAAESGYQEPVPTAGEAEPKGLTDSADPVAREHDAQQVDREIENKIPAEQKAEVDEPKTNGVSPFEEAKDAEAPAAVPEVTEKPAIEEPAFAAEPVEPAQAEKPAEPAPTPSPPKQATPQPAPAPKPAAPKTWASLAASANRVATPVTPAVPSPASSQPKAAPKPTPAQSTPSTSSSTVPQSAPSAPAAQRETSSAEGSDEWTAVPSTHNRNQSRQANTQPDTPMYRAFIGNVHEGVDGSELKTHLEQFGEIVYFDISRQKRSAFVDFKTAEGYNAAVAANPHNISGENLRVEQRYGGPRPGYAPRGQFQGGRGRGGFQGRGGFPPRGGRGGPNQGGAPRGRGSSIAA